MDKQSQGNLKRAPVPHPTDARAERHSRAVLVASGPSSAAGAVRSGWKRYARGEDGRGRGRRIDAARARAGDGGSRAGSREKLLATRRWIKPGDALNLPKAGRVYAESAVAVDC